MKIALTLELLSLAQCVILALLSYQDWRTKRISLLWLLILVLITFPALMTLQFPIHYIMVTFVLGALIVVKVFSLLAFRKSILGNGDLVLLLPLLMSLYLEELPVFLISAGVGGILTSKILREKSVPFVPSLAVAYAIVLFLRFTI